MELSHAELMARIDELTGKLVHTQLNLAAQRAAFMSFISNRYPDALEFFMQEIQNNYRANSADIIGKWKTLPPNLKIQFQAAAQAYNFDAGLN